LINYNQIEPLEARKLIREIPENELIEISLENCRALIFRSKGLQVPGANRINLETKIHQKLELHCKRFNEIYDPQKMRIEPRKLNRQFAQSDRANN